MQRLRRARRRSERVLVYGDYDADGVCGTALLLTALRESGVEAVPYLPHRLEDGYGLNLRVLERLAAEFDVLISVDCGVSNAAEIGWLQERGRDVIVVDHDKLPEVLPEALAILHPALGGYPWPFLSGSGVAWKLAQALLEDRTGDPEAEKWLLDLCCLGTVADMVPLLGENRAVVRFGLEVLRRSRRPGVQQLLKLIRHGEEISSEAVGYRLAPLLNAAGRMDHAQPALDLLLAATRERAEALMVRLCRYNDERRTVSRRVQAEAERVVEAASPVAFAYNKQWPAGVVGLVAGRLSELLSRPSVVIGSGGAHAVGSVRAPVGYNVLEMLQGVRELVITVGGHARAAGFSVSWGNVDGMREALLNSLPPPRAAQREERADAVIDGALLGWESVSLLEQFQPVGFGNERPALGVKDVPLIDWRPVGKTRDHAKMRFQVNFETMDGIGFGLAKTPVTQTLQPGAAVDVLGYLESNEYRGRRSLQLRVRDMAPAGTVRIVPVTSN